ncbi:MAG: histidine kinase N-terminal 7TM domain-containing protein [Patescibacteria group bacterium]
MLGVTLYSSVNWISGVIFLAFAVFLWTASKLASTRMYAAIAASMAIWSIGVALFVSNPPEAIPNWVIFFARFNHYFGGLAGPFFLYFTIIFPDEKAFKKSIIYLIILIEGLLAYPFLVTNAIIESSYVNLSGNFDLAWTFGPYVYLFYFNFLVLFLCGIIVLSYKYLKSQNIEEKRKIGYLLLASTLGSVLSLTVNVIFPFFQIYTYSWLGPPFTISWVAITSYVIGKYGALRIKTVASIVAVLVLIIILFINIFL